MYSAGRCCVRSCHAAAGLAFVSNRWEDLALALGWLGEKPRNMDEMGYAFYLDRINWIHDGVFLWGFRQRKFRRTSSYGISHLQRCQQTLPQSCSAAARSLAEGIHSYTEHGKQSASSLVTYFFFTSRRVRGGEHRKEEEEERKKWYCSLVVLFLRGLATWRLGHIGHSVRSCAKSLGIDGSQVGRCSVLGQHGQRRDRGVGEGGRRRGIGEKLRAVGEVGRNNECVFVFVGSKQPRFSRADVSVELARSRSQNRRRIDQWQASLLQQQTDARPGVEQLVRVCCGEDSRSRMMVHGKSVQSRGQYQSGSPVSGL